MMYPQISAKTHWLVALVAGTSLALSACGGDSSSRRAPPPDHTELSGTAAIGAPITSGTVIARCADGSGFTQTISTDENGRWTGTIGNSALPCALQVSGGSPPVTLHSYATTSGTVNITPLTDLALALATSSTPAEWFAAFDGTSVDVGTATDELLEALAGDGFSVPDSGTPFSTPFNTDGTGWDGLLDDLGDAIEQDAGLTDYDALVALVKDGNLDNLPPAPDTVPDPELPANLAVLTAYAGTYTVTGSGTGAPSYCSTCTDGNREHVRGSIIVQANGDIDFDTGISFSAADIVAIYDRKNVDFDRRIAVNYGPSDADERVRLYLDSDLNVVEIIHDSGDGEMTRALIGEIEEPSTFTVTGSISGASGNVSWETQAGGGVHYEGQHGNGVVTFTQAEGLAENSDYSVVVTAAPAGQACTVAHGSGTLVADVSNVAITCSDIIVEPTRYAITGTIAGASGNVGWATQADGNSHHNGQHGNGSVTFTLAAGMDSGSVYSISVTSAPAGQQCTVTHGSGTLSADVSNVAITCEDEQEPGEPSGLLYDFSGLTLQPALPQNMTPSAPTRTATDPSSQIASLYLQLGDVERARLTAPAPQNLVSTIDNNVFGTYYRVTQQTPDLSWSRELDIGFGEDGIANTGDDVVIAYTLQPDGPQGVEFSFIHPGPDGEWFSADDTAGTPNGFSAINFPTGTLLEYESASEGAVMLIYCLDAGDDSVPFSADDAPGCSLDYQIIVLDGEGHRGQVVQYDQAGPDGYWFTADDVVGHYTLVTYNAEGVSLGAVTYNHAGDDGQWFTSDDRVQQHTLVQLGEDYTPRYTATYNNRGADNTWFTADDVVSAWTYYGYDEQGNNILVATHTSKGSDGQWFTGDDSATALVSLKDEAGRALIAATLTQGPGADGAWLSGDESLNGYLYYAYDQNGNVTRQLNLSAKGADGKWFTADDLAGGTYFDRAYDAQGRITRQVAYNPSLAPGDVPFSDSQMSYYTLYASDFSTSVSVYRADFGADGLPFTADDSLSWPYAVNVNGGQDFYNQPGPDGIWFTADDVLSGYVRWTYDGQRKVLNEQFDSDDVRTAYEEAEDLGNGEYRLNRYTRNESDGFDLTSYAIIEEDSNGYPLWTIEYVSGESGWVESSVAYSEHDADGNRIVESWGYTSGTDGIWGTFDDFGYLSLTRFNNQGERVSAGTQRPGTDGIWGTADDTESLDFIYLLEHDTDLLALNTGVRPQSCGELVSGLSASGSLQVRVRDQNGTPLTGVTVQLNDNGATELTDAAGDASFTGLSGTQDVHLFRDGYSWESFYCVAPGNNVQLQGRLSSLTEAAHASKVSFYTQDAGRFVVRLLDETGRSMSRSYSTQGAFTYDELYFNLPLGSEVSGELWVFSVDNDGRLLDAQSLGQQTYTTIEPNLSPLLEDRETITLPFATPAPERHVIASPGTVRVPGNRNAPLTVDLGGLFGLPFLYEQQLGFRTLATAPDVTLPQPPTAATAQSSNWYAYYPVAFPAPGQEEVVVGIESGFQYPPLVMTQDGSGSTPTLGWTAARQISGGSFATANTLELRRPVNPVGRLSVWTLHTPAGEEQVTLPTPPVGITDPVLPAQDYTLVLRTLAVPGMDYHTLVAEHDLHAPSPTLAREEIVSGDEFTGGLLLR